METEYPQRKREWIPFAALLLVCGLVIGGWFYFFGEEELEESFSGLGSCNVMALDVHGCIVTYPPDSNFYQNTEGCDAFAASEELYIYLDSAKDDDTIVAVYLDIDSLGGQPQAAYEIEKAVKETGKPVVALIRGNGDSAAYWIASAADTIVASEESSVGGIGVTSSFVEYSKQNAAEGITYHSISTGEFKDTGDPNKPLTEGEEAYLRAGVEATFERFVALVAENRSLPIEAVRALADGSSYLGADALRLGLIDRLGSFAEADEELEALIGAPPTFCWPQYGDEYGV